MIPSCRAWLSALAATVVVAVAGCASTPSPTTPLAEGSTTPPSSAATASPSEPAASAATPSAGASPVASGGACSVSSQSGLLPSDRLVDLVIASTPTHDLLTFVFETSAPGPAGLPRGTLEAAKPPFSFAGSGLEFELQGEHAVQLRFSAMTIASESGEATYRGPTDVKPALPALRQAIQYDASEGIVGWYVGYDGPGCVTLVRDGDDVTVKIAHPEAPAG